MFEEQGLEGGLSRDRAASWKIAAILVPWLPPGEGLDRSASGTRFFPLLARARRGVEGDAMVPYKCCLVDDADVRCKWL